MKNRNDSIDACEGRHFDAYVAIPDAPNGHAVIVLQEIFGVTPHIRAVADRFAAAGYLARWLLICSGGWSPACRSRIQKKTWRAPSPYLAISAKTMRCKT